MTLRKCVLIGVLICSSVALGDDWNQWKLQYSRPAEKWTEALPVGNGFMGAMVFGNPKKERIQFNEDAVWAGQPEDYVNPEASTEVLARVRHLLLAGSNKEAGTLARKLLSKPVRQMPYQPFGDLNLEVPGHDGVKNCRRVLDLDHAAKLINNFLTLTGSSRTSLTGGGVYANMFSAHPPFQIDGNFGATSGITEMLLQNHTGRIHLLPALPTAWPNGSVSGLKARGDITVSINWKVGKLSATYLKASRDRTVSVCYQEQIKSLDLVAGQPVKITF